MKNFATNVLASMGMTIAALALLGCTADSSTNRTDTASYARATPTASFELKGEAACAGAAPLHVLRLQDADGGTLQLAFCRGVGWKQVGERKTDERAALRKSSLFPVAVAQAETPEAPTSDPRAIFIDGPTGYTFTWTSEAGWKFVGHVVDE